MFNADVVNCNKGPSELSLESSASQNTPDITAQLAQLGMATNIYNVISAGIVFLVTLLEQRLSARLSGLLRGSTIRHVQCKYMQDGRNFKELLSFEGCWKIETQQNAWDRNIHFDPMKVNDVDTWQHRLSIEIAVKNRIS
jgi:hypothetical protein